MFRTTLRNHFPTCQAEVRQSEGLQVHVWHERFQQIQLTNIKLKEKIEPSHLVSSVSFFCSDVCFFKFLWCLFWCPTKRWKSFASKSTWTPGSSGPKICCQLRCLEIHLWRGMESRRRLQQMHQSMSTLLRFGKWKPGRSCEKMLQVGFRRSLFGRHLGYRWEVCSIKIDDFARVAVHFYLRIKS